MQGSALAIVAGVGVAIVCIGLLVAVGWFVFNFLLGEHHILEFFELINREGKEGKEDESSFIPTPRPNLRAMAEAQDFDSALAKQAIKNQSNPKSTLGIPPSLPEASRLSSPPPLDQPFPDATPRLDSRPPQIYDRPDDEEDDALADFLDEH